MIRKTIIIVLVLAATATAALCVASRFLTLTRFYQIGDFRAFVRVDDYYVDVQTVPGNALIRKVPRGWAVNAQPVELVWDWRHPAYDFPGFTGGRVPLWLPFVLFALYPTIAFIRGPVRRYRRRKRGLCLRCGYDLRGNTSGICPECGKPLNRG